MTEEPTPDIPGRNNNALYGSLGVLLLLVSCAGVYFVIDPFGGGGATEVATTDGPGLVDAGPIVERSTAMVDDTLALPELEPDAGPLPDNGPIRTAARRPRRGRQCNGSMDRSGASRAVAEHRTQIRSCYERRLRVDPYLQGNLDVNMTVGTDGRVRDVSFGGSLRRDQTVTACVRGVAMGIRFPTVSEGPCATLSVPFRFTPQN